MNDSDFEFEVVVVGGGPAGLAAACVAAESGSSVGVLDDTPWLGGQIWRGQESPVHARHGPNVWHVASPSPPLEERAGESRRSPFPSASAGQLSNPQARYWLTRFHNSGATLLRGTSVVAAPRLGLLLAERNQRPCQIRWRRLILATGARELFLPFPGWTLPGVLGAGGLLSLAKHGWPVSNRRIIVAGSGPLLLAAAEGLRRHGAHVPLIAEQAPWPQVMGFGAALMTHGKLLQAIQLKLRLLGVPYRCGTWPVRTDGDDQLRNVTLTDGRRTWREACDLLACGFGLVPNVELPLALGCELRDGFVGVDSRQTTSVPDVYCAGEPTGIAGADSALVQGLVAGYAASGQVSKGEALFAERDAWHRFRDALARAFALRPELRSLAADETLLCRCEDVTLGQVRQFSNWRDAKLQSRCGMGACQGRVCGAAAKVILGWEMESVRPPVLPALVGSLLSQPRAEPPPADSHTEKEHRIAPVDNAPQLCTGL